MNVQPSTRQEIPTHAHRRPVSQYELARLVVMVLAVFVRERRCFTASDVTREVRRRYPDCEILHYDRTVDGAVAPWHPGEPFHRVQVACRGVQSLVHELMRVHLADEYTYRTVYVAPGRRAAQYVPRSHLEDRRVGEESARTNDRWSDAA